MLSAASVRHFSCNLSAFSQFQRALPGSDHAAHALAPQARLPIHSRPYARLRRPRAGAPPPPAPRVLYKNVDRLIWITHDADALLATWKPLGLTVLGDSGNVVLYDNKPTQPHFRNISARLDNLALEIIQSTDATPNVFSDFLTRHGDGIFAVLFSATASEQYQERQRLQSFGVNVLQEGYFGNYIPFHWTLFDTEPEGKYVLGLITHPDPAATQPPTTHDVTVTHIGILVRDPKAVAAYWHRLGFPSFSVGTEPQRDDFRYRGQPLHLTFGTAAQPFAQLTFEWIRADATPDNLYNDFYKSHHNQEGIQHLGFGVRNLQESVALFQKAGFQPLQSGHWSGPNNQIIPYMGMDDPTSGGGITAELVQAN